MGNFDRYQIKEVNKASLEMSVTVKICLEKDSCVYEAVLLDKKMIPKPGCSWDFDYTIPGKLMHLHCISFCSCKKIT